MEAINDIAKLEIKWVQDVRDQCRNNQLLDWSHNDAPQSLRNAQGVVEWHESRVRDWWMKNKGNFDTEGAYAILITYVLFITMCTFSTVNIACDFPVNACINPSDLMEILGLTSPSQSAHHSHRTGMMSWGL